MDYTPNLNLIKPAKAEQYNIEYPNANSDIIDAAFKDEVDTRIAAVNALQEQIDKNRNEDKRIGTVPIAKGGTGETAAQEALNALHGSVSEQADISADDEVTFIKRTAEDVSEGIPASLDVESVKLSALAQKVYDLMRGDTELFSATRNGLVPKSGSAGSAAFLSASGSWDNPSFSEDKIDVTVSKSYKVENQTIFRITADSPVTLVLDDCEKLGCTVTIINSSASLTHTLTTNNVEGSTNDSVLPMSYFKIAWNGSAWQSISAPAVGSSFTQYPQQESPDAVYPCTKWEAIDYDGAFFRAEGGNALSFAEKTDDLKLQSGMVKSHTHTFSGQTENVTGSGTDWSHGHDVNPDVVCNNGAPDGGSDTHSSANVGYLTNSSLRGMWYDTYSRGRNIVVSANLQHTHPFGGSTDSNDGNASETRPANYTYRIWLRTA